MHDDDFHGRGDEVTKRTKLITAVEMRAYELESRAQRAEKSIKSIKFWVQTAFGMASAIVVATLFVAHWANDVAHKGEIESVTTRVTVVETKVDTLKDMLRLMTEQSREIARTVHAPMVVQPEAIQLAPPQHPEAAKK